MKRFKSILCALLALLLACGAAAAEAADLYATSGEKLVILDQDGLTVTLTGDLEAIDNCNGIAGNFMVNLKCIVENHTGKTVNLQCTEIINGWNIDSYHTMNGASSLPDGTKAKSEIWFTTEDCEVTGYDDLETAKLTFYARDADTNESLFEATTGTIYFNAEGPAAGEVPAEEAPSGEIAGEIADIGAPAVALPEEAPSAATDLVSVKALFTANFSEAFGEDSAKPGMVDCLVVFDYANDAENRRLPEDPSEITLNINGINSYNIFKVTSNQCTYIRNVHRYSNYAEPLIYGNLLGGAEPVRMMALFYVNPNDFEGAGDVTLTVGDQVATFPAANARAIEMPDDVLLAEDDPEAAHRVADLRWRMDSIIRFDNTYLKARAYPGDDFKSLSNTFLTVLDESLPYGITIASEPHGSFTDTEYGIRFDGKNSLTDKEPPFDLEAIKADLPEQAGLIQYLVNNSRELARAMMNSKSTDEQVDRLMDNVGLAYLDLCDAIGMPDLRQFMEEHHISQSTKETIEILRNSKKHISADDIAKAEAEADAALMEDKDTVKAVQQALNDAGFDCGTPDGTAGKKTAAAISAYQEANGLEVTGTINRALLKALGI